MEYILASWLKDGALPMLRPYAGTFQYLTGGTDDPADTTARWEAATTGRQALAPILEITLEELLRVTKDPVPEGHTLYIAIRSAYQIGLPEADGTQGLMAVGAGQGTVYVLVAMMLLPVVLDDAARITREEQPEFFRELVYLDRALEPPANEPLHTIWQDLRTDRAESKQIYDQWVAANARAERLLLASLDEEQRAEYAKKKRFRVRAADGHEYLITYGSHGNIVQLRYEEDGTVRAVLNHCIVFTEHAPIYDQMLGQKLLLETDLEGFLATSNQTAMDVVVTIPIEPGEALGLPHERVAPGTITPP